MKEGGEDKGANGLLLSPRGDAGKGDCWYLFDFALFLFSFNCARPSYLSFVPPRYTQHASGQWLTAHCTPNVRSNAL